MNKQEKTLAYCYRNGDIGLGNHCPEGALPIISHDNRKELEDVLSVLATLCWDGHTQRIAGVAVADTDEDAVTAVREFRAAMEARLDNPMTMTFGFEITASNAPRLMRIEQLIAYAKALLEEGAVSTEANPEYAEVEEALAEQGTTIEVRLVGV